MNDQRDPFVDMVTVLQAATSEGRPERVIAELREHHPDVYDRIALEDLADVASATELILWLDLAGLLRQAAAQP